MEGCGGVCEHLLLPRCPQGCCREGSEMRPWGGMGLDGEGTKCVPGERWDEEGTEMCPWGRMGWGGDQNAALGRDVVGKYHPRKTLGGKVTAGGSCLKGHNPTSVWAPGTVRAGQGWDSWGWSPMATCAGPFLQPQDG